MPPVEFDFFARLLLRVGGPFFLFHLWLEFHFSFDFLSFLSFFKTFFFAVGWIGFCVEVGRHVMSGFLIIFDGRFFSFHFFSFL